MKSALIVNALVLLSAVSCILGSGFLLFAMIGEINRQLAAEQRISYIGGHWEKYSRIYSEYRRLYPEGRLLLLYKVLLVSGLGLLLVFAWRIGMFG